MSTTRSQGNPKPNRLIREKSPYLLQHARNPVDWHPWSDEAFERARAEDKPVFLSVGYSTCHWCHVMAHESFEDAGVARLMNETFVCIKVDREERPDVDGIYMTVCQIMTGGGGWPLTILMTPERKPFFAGTYIPKENRHGRIGMIELIQGVRRVWETRRGDVLSSAEQVTLALQNASAESAAGEAPGTEACRAAFEALAGQFDGVNGGFGGAPKFPSPHHFLFLLRYGKRTGEPRALEMVEKSLSAMRRGGVYDQIGFGFHRYSTDARWLLPHFEKMLYDQAMLSLAYLETFQATGEARYAQTVEEIVTYVLRDLKAPGGGFFCAEDADSEGEEGKFYLWSEPEIREALDPDEAALVIRACGVEKGGNFLDEAARVRTGRNVLYLAKAIGEGAGGRRDRSSGEAFSTWEGAREKLFRLRERRVRPGRDDKVLTDWNGLMIAALAKGAAVLGRQDWAGAAAQAARFVLGRLRDGRGRLLHRYRDGEAAIGGMLDDYAFFTWGLLELYEATFETGFLKTALELADNTIDHFRDDRDGGFFVTADDGEEILLRQKDSYDGAIPSGNSVMMLNLLRLSRITGRQDLEQKAVGVARAFARNIGQIPSAYSQLMVALEFLAGPSFEIVVSGKPGMRDTQEMLDAVRRLFLPNRVLLFRPQGAGSGALAAIAPYTKDMKADGGRATAYVCRNYACSKPVQTVDEMMGLLGVPVKS
ncbi:MAG: thioredoxin domain-containing protein [Syntrophales bacterium]|nr:thioredoxin domain-containing protein [Syntrophales bacterium]